MAEITPEEVPSVDPLENLVEKDPEPIKVEVKDKKAKKEVSPEWILIPIEDLQKVLFTEGERRYQFDHLGFRGDYRLREVKVD